MNGSAELLALAALLERAYRLALDAQDDMRSTASGRRRAATELVEVLDDARVSLLNATRPAQPAAQLAPGRSANGS